ncbi:uncharacterized protein T551_02931 [Pneumocystis jirovecii RU7]|uniref:WIBG Mago-binding domain-containing protein n=1 Tax=Pneumocystis jirovecii (strain RU7) TaxID=1408657 RepID=A0A0W4ZHX0_PNEJ7|nr:uncharacterized protein T551_02931 [Pneumocystis jirovecii RU7]KTW27964.1 hypothetical protein T551_02931 [Pneumocystis jirovecii RU7]
MLKASTQNNKERASGIKSLQDGNFIIPSSVRHDGSVRSERRVRPGYIPPEDIAVYRTVHHDQHSQRVARICPGTLDYYSSGTATFPNLSKSAKKRSKQKEKSQNLKNDNNIECSELQVKNSLVVDVEKRIRNLKKKIKETQKLEMRFKNGEALLDDQIEKIMSLDTLVQKLKGLEVSSV